MSGLKAPLHGRTHLPGGSDPIPATAGTGIQFDTNPQSGNWLHVDTTSFDGATGWGIDLVSTQGGNVVDLGMGNGVFDLEINSGATSQQLRIDRFVVNLDNGEALDLGTDYLILALNNTELNAGDTAGWIMTLPTGGVFQVNNHTNSPLFRVNENGDVHILTGKTITADL